MNATVVLTGLSRQYPAALRRLTTLLAPALASGGAVRCVGDPRGENDMPDEEDQFIDLEARRREERRAVEEGGGGVSEGFELAEDDLVEHASHGDELSASRILRDAGTLDEEQTDAVYGEADEERHSD